MISQYRPRDGEVQKNLKYVYGNVILFPAGKSHSVEKKRILLTAQTAVIFIFDAVRT
jgi:hypothetical protein